MKIIQPIMISVFLGMFMIGNAYALTDESIDVRNPRIQDINKKCVTCHLKENKSLVIQWETSPHAAAKGGQVGCFTCHAAEKNDEYSYKHEAGISKQFYHQMTAKVAIYLKPSR